MKTLLMLIALSALGPVKDKTTVYICDSPYGKKYHLVNNCRGLSRCTHRIIEIKFEDAKKRKMELCKFED
jgi:hypothetical protein